jgi:hypothetical protein
VSTFAQSVEVTGMIHFHWMAKRSLAQSGKPWLRIGNINVKTVDTLRRTSDGKSPDIRR